MLRLLRGSGPKGAGSGAEKTETTGKGKYEQLEEKRDSVRRDSEPTHARTYFEIDLSESGGGRNGGLPGSGDHTEY